MSADFKPVLKKYFLTIFIVFGSLVPSAAYSILAHEAIIDASWKKHIIPLLKEKYPSATREDLLMAHSYAYGGSIVADMGYMPFGNGFFTDLVHYVRSGDFVEALIADAQNLNEYAFALGAMSHYMADKYGHSLSTNLNVPLVYPKLKEKFGNVVTYNDDHTSHSRMEFSYDVLQIGKNNYTSEGYHDFIGFNIAVPVLQRAFYETYGQNLSGIFSNINSAINTLRWGVRNLFPTLTKSAYRSNEAEIKKLHPGITARKFQYKMSRRSFNLQYGKERKENKFFAKVAVFLIKILPKIGPLKTLKFKSPGAEGEKLFAESFETILDNYKEALAKAGTNDLDLADVDFDTGKPTRLGEYELADKTYEKLVEKLQKDNYRHVTPQLQQNLVGYYNSGDTLKLVQRYPEKWRRLKTAIKQISLLKPIKQDTLKSVATTTRGK